MVNKITIKAFMVLCVFLSSAAGCSDINTGAMPEKTIVVSNVSDIDIHIILNVVSGIAQSHGLKSTGAGATGASYVKFNPSFVSNILTGDLIYLEVVLGPQRKMYIVVNSQGRVFGREAQSLFNDLERNVKARFPPNRVSEHQTG